MRLNIALFVGLLALVNNAFAQEGNYDENVRNAALAKSDSLFALGVDLYNAGKYQEAIPIFTESDKIDKAVLDSTSNRRDYSAMWIASCYYQLGDTIKASETHKYYSYAPVDRRLTVKSDSLAALGQIANNNEDLEKALSFFDQCAEIEKAVVGEDHIWYLNTLSTINILYFNLAKNYASKSNYAEAIGLITKEIEICEKLYGREHPYYATLLNNLANYNSYLGNYAEAIRLGTEAMNIREKVLGKEHPDYALSLSNLAYYKSDLGNYTEAVRLVTEAMNIHEKVCGKGNAGYATLLNNLANYNSYLGNYAEAIRLGTEAMNIREKVLGKEHPDYALSLNDLALHNSHLGYFTEAVSLVTEAMNIHEKVYGKGNAGYATLLSNLAGYNSDLSNYTEAIRLGTEALNIRERALGTEHPDYATSLSNLAGYNASLGNYSEAIRLCTKAMNIRKRALGTEHPDYATSLSNLAGYNASLGNYSEAIRLCTEAMNIHEKVYGNNHPKYATSLNNLAYYNASVGNYSEAIRLGTEALNIYEKVYGTEHPDYATSLNNLARYNSDLGNYAEAVRLCTKAMNICEKVYGKQHPAYATSLSNLAGYNSDLSNYTEAIRLGTEALNIYEKVYGTEHPDYALLLSNLACMNTSRGDYSEAIRLCTEALNIREKVLGKEHPDYAMSLSNLADYHSDLGNCTEAVRLGIEALNIREKVLGKEHPDYALSLYNLAGYGLESGNSQMTDYYSIQSSESISALIKKTFADLTTAQRTMFWGKYNYWYEVLIHRFSYCMPSDTLALNGYNGVLLSKGLLLNSEIEFSKLIQESGDSEVIAMYDDLRTLRLQINKLIETPITERFASVDSLERIAQAKEQALIDRSKVYGDYTDNLVITCEQVQEKLTEKDIAVEFVSFPLNADSTMYIAYTLRKDWEYPRMIPLFEEKQLKEVHLIDLYTTIDISELVWKPLEEVLDGVETVYFAPSGELYNIAIESVPDYATNGATIVSDSRAYYRLSSTRELALKKDKDVWKEAAVYGGLKYGMTAEGLTADSRSFNPNRETNIAYTGEFYNIADTLSVIRGGVLAERLPGTLIEAEAIDKSLETSGVSSTLYTDSIGTEASFKNLNGKKKSIMHIGTHGFYWTEKEARNLDYKFLMNDETSGRYVEDKQLTRSGLLFAGANYVLSGSENQLPEGVDDGILTAKELTTIDLRGLDLVVLSACQTGLGEITGDGVFGLQRGFKKAGAQTIVMSLWKVNDEATRLFMTKFFEKIKLDKEGHATNKHEAFLAAQHYLREEYEMEQTRTINSNLTASQIRRLEREGKSVEVQTITEKVKPYQDPEYWAAFIMLDGIN